MLAWEIKKIMRSKTGVLVFGVFIFISGIMFFLKPELETERSYRNEKYELIQDQRPGADIANEKLSAKRDQLEIAAGMEAKDYFLRKLSKMSAEKLEKDSVMEYREVSFYKVFSYRGLHPLIALGTVAVIIMVFSGIYTNERTSCMDNIILSSKNKCRALYSKLMLSFIFTGLFYGGLLLVAFLQTWIQYGPPVNGGLQAFRIYDMGMMLNGSSSITWQVCANITFMYMSLASIAVFAALFSFATPDSISSVSAILVFIGAGKAATLLRFLPANLLDTLSMMNYVEIMFRGNKIMGMYMGDIAVMGKSIGIMSANQAGIVGLIVLGVASNMFVFKRILTK